MSKFIVLATCAAFILSGCGQSQTATIKPQAAPAATTATTNGDNTVAPAAATPGQTAAKIYTMADVSKHASAGDCWQVIDGKVYDVTPYVDRHEGGPTILKGCGKEASEMFHQIAKHGGRATDMLPQYYIGDLAK